MLKTVIVDDEILILELLKNMMAKEPNIDIIGEFTNSRQALESIMELKPDLVFLDIEMPGMNGIELATQILNDMDSVGIVFVTAYDKYAVQAFKLNAIHYILKPPNIEDIRQVVSRVVSDKRTISVDKSEKVYVNLLGGVSVKSQSGSSLKWATAKTEELFALFMLSGKKEIDKWQIIEKLWPDSQEGKSEQLLYSTVYRLKKTLGENGIDATVKNHLGLYKMNVQNIWCDVYAFEDFYKNFDKAGVSCETYEKLLSLYKGELFGTKDYKWCELYKYELSRKFNYMLGVFERYYSDIGDKNKIMELDAKRELLG